MWRLELKVTSPSDEVVIREKFVEAKLSKLLERVKIFLKELGHAAK